MLMQESSSGESKAKLLPLLQRNPLTVAQCTKAINVHHGSAGMLNAKITL